MPSAPSRERSESEGIDTPASLASPLTGKPIIPHLPHHSVDRALGVLEKATWSVPCDGGNACNGQYRHEKGVV